MFTHIVTIVCLKETQLGQRESPIMGKYMTVAATNGYTSHSWEHTKNTLNMHNYW